MTEPVLTNDEYFNYDLDDGAEASDLLLKVRDSFETDFYEGDNYYA